MCSPELTRGICCICFGTLTPENTLVDDLHEGRGGVHRGKCAYLAGIVAEEHLAEYDRRIKAIHSSGSGWKIRQKPIQDLYQWIDSLGIEDHHDNSGPE